MKLLSWLAAALFLLGVVSTTLLLLQPESSAEEKSRASLTEDLKSAEIPAELREAVRKSFAAADALLLRNREEVESRTRKALTPELKDALAQWESDASIRPSLGLKIADDLQVARSAQKLDLLILVTQDNEVFSAEAPAQVTGPADRQALAKAAIILTAEPFFREGKAAAGIESFPAEHGLAPPPGEPRPASEANVFVAAGLPIWLRPDAPHSVLMGGISIQSIARAAEGAGAAAKDKIRWHAFLEDKAAGPIVIAGAKLGSPVRRACYQCLIKDGSTEESAFDGEPIQAGRWALLRSLGGQVLGGWGITLDPAYLKTRLAPPKADPPEALASFPAFAREWGYYAGGATVFFGLAYAALLYRSLRRRRSRRRVRVMPPMEHSKPIVPPPPAPRGDDLISQFEINWKTFASYTQDLLHQKLKELEDAPQKGVKEVREQVSRLAEALTDVKKDLAEARTEARDTTHGVVEKVAHIVAEENREKKELSADGEALLKKIEGDFERATSRFTQLDETVVRLASVFGEKQAQEIEDRVRSEVAKLEAQWNERVAVFAAEIDDAKKQGEALLEDAKKASETEASLRAGIQAAADREESLRRELEGKAAEVDRAAQERETAWRRERDVIAELHTAKAREEAAVARAAEVEATSKRLEASIAEGVHREDELRRETEDARAAVEKLEEAIKEIYRQEGRFQQDLERKEKEFEHERQELGEKVKALESRSAELSAQSGEASSERERLRQFAAGREEELQALRRSLEALKEEKGHFERAARGLGEEVEALRTERTTFNAIRFRELEEENTRLRSEVPVLEKELHKERHDSVNATQALDMLKIELMDQAALLTRAGEEITTLRSELESRGAELERARKAAESKSEDLAPAKAALEKTLRAAKADGERLEKTTRDHEKRLRESDEERLRLKTRLAEAEGEWRSRQNDLELRAAEAARKLAESERRLAEAENTSRGLRMQLDQAKISTRSSDDMTERLRTLERERTDLTSSLDRLSKELERVRTEAEGVRRFQGALVEGCIPAAIVAFDSALKVFAWNPRAEGLWNRPAGAVLGRLLEELGVKGIDRQIVDLAKRALDDRKAVSLDQASFTDEHGRVRHVRVSCEPILGPQGEALGAVLIVDEITEKVESEIEARLQNLFSQSLTRSLPGALVVVDTQRRVISWNRSAETILGVPEKYALGEDFFALATPLAKDAFKRHFEDARRDRLPHRIRVRLDQKGVPTQFAVTQSPFLGSDDTVRGTILLIQEIVEGADARK